MHTFDYSPLFVGHDASRCSLIVMCRFRIVDLIKADEVAFFQPSRVAIASSVGAYW